MIARWHYCIGVEMVTGCVDGIVNVSNCKELWIARRKHQHIQPQGKAATLEKQKQGYIWTEREREREIYIMDRTLEKEGRSLQ